MTAGLSSIGVWREPVAEAGLDRGRGLVNESGLRVSSLCRGGFFTAADPADIERGASRTTGRRSTRPRRLGAATLVLVPGGLPAGDRDLVGARSRVAAAIERLVPYAREHGVTLGIEPMNPIYAADRGVISTLAQALDIAERFEPTRSASSSTPSTCGGSRASQAQLAPRRRTHPQLPGLRLDHPAAGRTPCWPAA